jgi:predicted nicotinamide N-methyase
MNAEEANRETLECARYGEEDDLRALLMSPGVTANYADDMGTTALHRAAANGEVGCLKILKEFGALHSPNAQGNFPIHWAALNGKAESLRFLFESYEVDVLAKNAAGRSTLTEAFQSQKPDVIEICLSHNSANEENLMKMDPGTDAKVTVEGGGDGDGEDDSQNLEKHAVFHLMDFTQSSFYGNQIGVQRKVVRVRELPISRADNPFGSETAPQDDTTGLGLWPAAVLLSRWVVQQHASLRGKVVIELGAGCGLPGLAAAVCCGPKSVYVTDIHDPTLNNAAFNARLNAAGTTKCEGKVSASEGEGDQMNVESQEGNLLFEDVVVDSAALAGASSSSDITGQLNSVTLNDGSTTVFQTATASASASATSTSSPVKTQLKVAKVSWSDPATFPPEKADVLIGSDLVYESRILTLLTAAVDGMLAQGKVPCQKPLSSLSLQLIPPCHYHYHNQPSHTF